MSVPVLQSTCAPKQSNACVSYHNQQYQVTVNTLTGTKMTFTRDHPITLHELKVAIYTKSAIPPTSFNLYNENNELCDGIVSGNVLLKLTMRGGHYHHGGVCGCNLCCCGCSC